jgi:hypothetical protein
MRKYELMMRSMKQASWLLLLCSSVLSGCGKGLPLVTVTGEVQFSNGNHLPDANIEFRRNGTDEAAIASGIVDKEGKFELYTAEVGEGALPGDYQAIIVPRVHGGKHAVKIDSIPQKYHSYATSPLKFHVAEDESQNHFQIKIDAPKNTRAKSTALTKKTAE